MVSKAALSQQEENRNEEFESRPIPLFSSRIQECENKILKITGRQHGYGCGCRYLWGRLLAI
jgi:hypothetical protein